MPSDWNAYWRRCPVCLEKYHLSGGDGCDKCPTCEDCEAVIHYRVGLIVCDDNAEVCHDCFDIRQDNERCAAEQKEKIWDNLRAAGLTRKRR
jgi:hypothetical protein